ncbi:MAG: LysR substrate-binding domain-containing protein [Pseudomonadota bacterium]
MTLTELRYVITVAKTLHFGRAADACFVSQPTLSVGIRKLEEELGVRIFERNRNEVLITPEGQQLVDQASRVLEAANTFKDIAAAQSDPIGKQIRLGVIYTVGPFLVPALINQLKRAVPDTSLVIRENFTDALAEEMKRGEIDAAILSEPFEEPAFASIPLYDEEFLVVSPGDHSFAKARSVAPGKLEDENLILLAARNCFRDQVLHFCPECNPGQQSQVSQAMLEGSSLNTIVQMVATGAGITVIPATWQVDKALDKLLAVKPFTKPKPQRRVSLYYRRTFGKPQAIRCLVEAVRAAKFKNVNYLS